MSRRKRNRNRTEKIEDAAFIVKLRKEGKTYAEISEKLGLHREQIGRVLREKGLIKHKRRKMVDNAYKKFCRLYAKGMKISAICEILCIGTSRFRDFSEKFNRESSKKG